MHLAVKSWLCKESCVIIELAANRTIEGWGCGGAMMGHYACDDFIHIYSHGCKYIHVCMQEAPCASAALRLPRKWMCWPHQSLQLVERLRKRRLGSSPVRGEFASVLPWRWTGSGFCWMKMDGSEMGGEERWRGGGLGGTCVSVCVPGSGVCMMTAKATDGYTIFLNGFF